MGKVSLIDKLKLINRCRIHGNEPEFVRFVLEGYQNPEYLHLQTYGNEYAGETIYLIDEMGNGVGFFAELGVTLIMLYFAWERGLTPYIHWGENYLYYESGGMDGETNAFLYYFAPASHVRGISAAGHVVRSDTRHYEQVKALFGAVSYDVSDEYIDAMADMLRRYIKYNDRTAEYLKEQYERLLGDKKTLGIHYRGTDFRRQYNNHPVAVRIEQTIEEVSKLLENGYYEQIFVATDEEAALKRFRETFGDKVRAYEDVFRDEGSDESIAFSVSDRAHHKYLLGLEVLRDQYTLTNCDGLVCGYSNVTFMARIMRRGWLKQDYKDYVLINNGIYHNNNSFSKSGHAPKKNSR